MVHQSDAIRDVLAKLRSKIMRLVSQGSITDQKQRQKLEHLLRTKKWNPYCFRHSAITDDSNHLPEYALKKKVRWVTNSKQGNRYIKNSWSDDLKNKILEHSGIEIANKRPRMVSRTCGSCGYVNKLESKFCERVGCHYPQTQLALDEIKAAEEEKFQALRNEMVQSKIEIKDRFKAYEDKMADFIHDIQSSLNQAEIDRSSNKMIRDKMAEIIERVAPGFDWYHEVFGPKANRLTPEVHKKIDEWLKILNPQIEAENREREVEIQKRHKVLMDSMDNV